MGEKTVDRATIRSMGERIGTETQEPLKNALRKADAAQEVNISNWTAVTKSYAVAYTVAAEYVTQSWDTKIDDTAKLADALAEMANRWDEIEQASTITLEQAMNAIEGASTGA